MYGTWVSYHWGICKKVGQQVLDLWWKELLTSLVISGIAYAWIRLTDSDPNAWKNFRIILISTAITFGLFGVGHVIRAPWLIHRRESETQEESSEHWGFGILGVGAIVAILVGAAYLTMYVWNIREVPVSITIHAPPAPQMVQNRVMPQGVEPRDSLRRRTLKLADEYTEFFMKSQENAPPVAIPTTPEPPPSEEQKKARQVYRDYWGKIDKYYADHFSARFVGIVKEYESKGAKVGFLANDFAQRRPQIPPTGSTWEGMDEISRFRELAYHVDARDHLIVVAPRQRLRFWL